MASLDPRLADPALLMLAAWNLTHGPPRPPLDWRQCEGLASLLEVAKRLPRRDPWALPSVEEDDTGMGRLVREARQWRQQREG